MNLQHFAGPALAWTALATLLNLLWEIAHLPLYTISRDADGAGMAFAVFHCTAGDGLIALASFMFAGMVLRDASWPLSRPALGAAIAALLAVLFTIYSEWRNVYEVKAWGYLPAMPLVFGIGLSPLMQWLVIPPAATLLLLMRVRKVT